MKNKRLSSACYAIKDLVITIFVAIGAITMLSVLNAWSSTAYWAAVIVGFIGILICVFRTTYNDYENNRYFMVTCITSTNEEDLSFSTHFIKMDSPLYNSRLIRAHIASKKRSVIN